MESGTGRGREREGEGVRIIAKIADSAKMKGRGGRGLRARTYYTRMWEKLHARCFLISACVARAQRVHIIW